MVSIFVVEDEAMICEGLCRYFDWETMGAEVAGSAYDGQKGLEQIRALMPDIVLTDVVMPRMNGMDMIMELRKEGWDGEVVFLSAHQQVDFLKRAFKYKAADYVFKPIENEELLSVMRSVIERVRQKRYLGRPPGAETQERLDITLRQLHERDAARLKDVWVQRLLKSLSLNDSGDAELRRWWKEATAAAVDLSDLGRIGRDLCESLLALLAARTGPGRLVRLPDTAALLHGGSEGELYAELCAFVRALSGTFHESLSELKFQYQLEQHVRGNIAGSSIDLLADLLGMSRSQLTKNVRRVTGQSANDYIVGLRMQTARELLQNTSLRIYEIAEQVGYHDLRYFSRLFREETGMLPTEYRKSCAGKWGGD